MKIKMLFAAMGLAVATIGAAAPAHADRWDHSRRWDHDRRWDHGRRWHHDRRWDRGRHWRRHHVRCWIEWHHHHRVRVCR